MAAKQNLQTQPDLYICADFLLKGTQFKMLYCQIQPCSNSLGFSGWPHGIACDIWLSQEILCNCKGICLTIQKMKSEECTTVLGVGQFNHFVPYRIHKEKIKFTSI